MQQNKNELRARPDGQYLMKFNNCKPQPGISSLRAKFREMRAENLNAVFPHMGEQSQKYRTKNLLTEDSRKSTIVFTFSFSFSA